jgi:hypothetical protein
MRPSSIWALASPPQFQGIARLPSPNRNTDTNRNGCFHRVCVTAALSETVRSPARVSERVSEFETSSVQTSRQMRPMFGVDLSTLR